MIIEKPWGREEILLKSDDYVVKKLVMKAGHACSLQYHNLKHESFYVLSGKFKFTCNDSILELKAGDFFDLPPKMIHRMEALEDGEYLECSTNHLDDVVRLQDNYNR